MGNLPYPSGPSMCKYALVPAKIKSPGKDSLSVYGRIYSRGEIGLGADISIQFAVQALPSAFKNPGRVRARWSLFSSEV